MGFIVLKISRGSRPKADGGSAPAPLRAEPAPQLISVGRVIGCAVCGSTPSRRATSV